MNQITKPNNEFDATKPHGGNTWARVGYAPISWDTFARKDFRGRRMFTREQVAPRFSDKRVMAAMLAEYNGLIVANEARKAQVATKAPAAPVAAPKAPAFDAAWLAKHDADLARTVAEATAKAVMASLQQQGRLV